MIIPSSRYGTKKWSGITIDDNKDMLGYRLENFDWRHWTNVTRPPQGRFEGQMGYNDDIHGFEFWNGSAWIQFVGGGGGGITKLSQLDIDVDKNWLGHSIQNISGISYAGNFSMEMQGINYNINGAVFSFSGEVGKSMWIFQEPLEVSILDGHYTVTTTEDITFYPKPPARCMVIGEGTDLFRVQDMGDPEKHVVDSIYHDDTYNLDIVGTRWAMKVGTTDYHIGLGLTYDNTNGIMHSGLISYLNDFEVFGKYGTGVGIHNYGIGISKESFIYPSPIGDVYNFAFMYGIDESNHGYTGIFGIGFSSSRRAFTEQHLRYVFYEKKDSGNFVDVGMILRGDITGIGHYTWKLNATEGMFFSTDRSVWLQSKELMWLRLVDEATATEYGGLYTDYIDYGYGYAEVYGQYGYLEFTNTDINLYSDTLNFNVNVAGSISLSGSAIGITSTSGDITLNPSGAVDFSQKQSKNHVLEKWTTSTRPTNPVEGQIGYNTDTHQFEGWNGSTWVILG